MSTTFGSRVADVGRLGEADRGSANALVLAAGDDDAVISLCFCSAVTSAATDCANDAMTANNAAVVALPALLSATISFVDDDGNGAVVGSNGAGETAVRVAGACSALSSPVNAVVARVSEEEDDENDDSGCD